MSTSISRLFEGGAPTRLRAWGRVRAGDVTSIARSAVWVGAISWAPLAVLSLAQGQGQSFAGDFGAHARYLLAAPLLIVAELVTLPRLGLISHHFLQTGLVSVADTPRFEAAITSTLRWRDSGWAEIAIVALAYSMVIAFMVSLPGREIPEWHRATTPSGGASGHSWAAWWHALISLPLLLMLVVTWLWRLVLWTRFLICMARIDLQLIPPHPDRAGGLKFVAYSLRAFAPVGFAIGVVAAGGLANSVFHEGESPLDHTALVIATCTVVLIACAIPPLVFTRKLLDTWRRGVFEYGALADSIGQRFESKWVSKRRENRMDDRAFESPDFSATTDLYQMVSNAYAMRIVPADLTSMLALLVATALPFVPVFALAIPFDQIVKGIASLLL